MLISNMAAKFVRADIHPVNLFLSFSIYLHLDEAKVIFFVQRTKPMSCELDDSGVYIKTFRSLDLFRQCAALADSIGLFRNFS